MDNERPNRQDDELDQVAEILHAWMGNRDGARHDPLIGINKEFASKLRWRIAGYSKEGFPHPEEMIDRDVSIIHLLDKSLVVPSETIQSQIESYRLALDAVNGDVHKVADHLFKIKKDGTFFDLGGHVSEISESTLKDVITRDGFGLICEYEDGVYQFPVAYHIGFPRVPEQELAPDVCGQYPTLNYNSMGGSDADIEWFKDHADQIYTIWRTGVVRNVSASIRKELEELNLKIHDKYEGFSPRRLGLSVQTKRISAYTAQALGSLWVVCNIARLQRPHQPLDATAMPNQASKSANVSDVKEDRLFRPLSMSRRKVNRIPPYGDTKAIAHWDVYGNVPSAQLEITSNKNGPLIGKYGNSILDTLDRVGSKLTHILTNRNV